MIKTCVICNAEFSNAYRTKATVCESKTCKTKHLKNQQRKYYENQKANRGFATKQKPLKGFCDYEFCDSVLMTYVVAEVKEHLTPEQEAATRGWAKTPKGMQTFRDKWKQHEDRYKELLESYIEQRKYIAKRLSIVK